MCRITKPFIGSRRLTAAAAVRPNEGRREEIDEATT